MLPGRREALFLLARLGIFLGNISPGFADSGLHLLFDSQLGVNFGKYKPTCLLPQRIKLNHSYLSSGSRRQLTVLPVRAIL
jgi:hypothetical protein